MSSRIRVQIFRRHILQVNAQEVAKVRDFYIFILRHPVVTCNPRKKIRETKLKYRILPARFIPSIIVANLSVIFIKNSEVASLLLFWHRILATLPCRFWKKMGFGVFAYKLIHAPSMNEIREIERAKSPFSDGFWWNHSNIKTFRRCPPSEHFEPWTNWKWFFIRMKP